MTNIELMIRPLRKYAVFSGRARRKEYWLFIPFALVVGFLGGVIDAAFLGYEDLDDGVSPLSLLLTLVFVVPSIALLVRRLHDLDKGGWWILPFFIPIVNLVLMIVFLTRSGTSGTNRFGDDPLSEKNGHKNNIKNAYVSKDTTEAKLKEIEQMFEKSLITDEERMQMRNKVLGI